MIAEMKTYPKFYFVLVCCYKLTLYSTTVRGLIILYGIIIKYSYKKLQKNMPVFFRFSLHAHVAKETEELKKKSSRFLAVMAATPKKYSTDTSLAMDFDSSIQLGTERKVSGTEKDLLALGIRVDNEVIERLQCLGLYKAWEVASQAAKSMKERNPERTFSKYPTVVYSGTPTLQAKAKHAPVGVEGMPVDHQDWLSVDSFKVNKVILDLGNSESSIPPHIRADVNRIIQHLRVNYGRNPDMFIQQMLGRKSSKV